MPFEGFDRDAIELLGEMPGWSAKNYEREKSRLKVGVMEPGAALIEDLAEALDADLTVVRRSSVSPLHRDLRFAKAGSPRYKDHLLLTAWTGSDKKTAPTLWLRLAPDGVGFASGMGFDPKARARWREAVGGKPGEALAKALKAAGKGATAGRCEYAGEQLKKVPAPWPDDHPRAELLRMNGFQARFMAPLPASVSKPAFVRWCTTRFKRLLPVHDWLVREVAAKR